MEKNAIVAAGHPLITDVVPAEGVSAEELLQAAFSLEIKSDHPQAKAIAEYGEGKGLSGEEVMDYRTYAGKGISGVIDDITYHVGKRDYITDRIVDFSCIADTAAYDEAVGMEGYLSAGRVPLYVCTEKKLLGAIMIADRIRPESEQAIMKLKKQGIYTVMFTNYSENMTESLKNAAGVDEVIWCLLPEDREEAVRSLKERGRVLMLGEGVNDIPALMCADAGFTLSDAADPIVGSADALLQGGGLYDIPDIINRAKGVKNNIFLNLFFAFVINLICIPFVAGIVQESFGFVSTPVYGLVAMVISVILICLNSFRISIAGLGKTE